MINSTVIGMNGTRRCSIVNKAFVNVMGRICCPQSFITLYYTFITLVSIIRFWYCSLWVCWTNWWRFHSDETGVVLVASLFTVFSSSVQGLHSFPNLNHTFYFFCFQPKSCSLICAIMVLTCMQQRSGVYVYVIKITGGRLVTLIAMKHVPCWLLWIINDISKHWIWTSFLWPKKKKKSLKTGFILPMK